MGQEYSWEVRERAEELYIYEGVTLEQAAEAAGVAASTVKRWAVEGDWTGRKKEHRAMLSDIKRKKCQLHRVFLEKALNSLDPQDVYAVARLEAALQRTGAKAEDKPEANIDRPALFLEDLKFIAGVLKEEDPEGLKVLARHFDLIVSRFKANHAQTT